MSDGGNAAIVAALHEAIRAQDLDALSGLLAPDVEAEGQKGSFHGPDEVRRWLTAAPDGHLYSRVELDEVREVGDEWVAAAARRQWRWREGDELAEEEGFGILFRLRERRVLSWRQRFGSIAEAVDAIPPG